MPSARTAPDTDRFRTTIDVVAAPPDSAATSPELPADLTGARRRGGELAREHPDGAGYAIEGARGDQLAAFVEGLLLGGYRFGVSASPPARTVRLCAASDDPGLVDAVLRHAVETGRRAAAATCWARDLANERAIKTPTWLAQQATRVLTPLGVHVVSRDVAWLDANGFGGVLAVGAGSVSPPCLIEASWRPRDAKPDTHLVLVGKGITYDTGGLNRKVGDGMRTMYTDMAGGAAALGALRAVATSRLPVRLTVLVPTAENSFGGGSYRPGDVVRHVGGRTSEIHNTDAEGRLVLADALAWAAAKLKPTAMVDIATLTGAAKIALGMRLGGLFATSDPLAGALLAAGEASDERLWRLPLAAEYESTLRSDVADATNAPGNPGSITAALFLQHFVRAVPWAHLDVAGPARAGADDGIITQGATGFGVRLLHAWVAAQA